MSSQRMSAAEWVKQQDTRMRSEMSTSSQSSRQMEPMRQMQPMEPMRQMQQPRQIINLMDQSVPLDQLAAPLTPFRTPAQPPRDDSGMGERLQRPSNLRTLSVIEAEQAQEESDRGMQEWRDKVDQARAREKARQAALPKQSGQSGDFLGSFTSGNRQYDQFAVRQPDGKTKVALGVRSQQQQQFKLY